MYTPAELQNIDQDFFLFFIVKSLSFSGLEQRPRRTTLIALSKEWICPERPPLPDPGIAKSTIY